MSSKRALIVDDSKAARAFLTRILERYELRVDAVESAEEAIEYLTRQRPDVVFMDHLMPGMDGFQAVQAIKGDPRTATIPILMYTSQEGELYLSQARALGAVGVLSKQVRTADVARALEQLRLLEPSAPASDAAPSPPAVEPGAAAAAPSAPPAAETSSDAARARVLVEPLLSEQLREVRRLLHAQLELQSERVASDVRTVLDRYQPPAPATGNRLLPSVALWFAAAAFVLAAGLGLLLDRALDDTRSLQQQLSASEAQLASVAAQVRSLEAQNAALSVPVAPPPAPPVPVPAGPVVETGLQIEAVPFGEAPFALGRVERIQALLDRLLGQGFRGTVQIRSFPGRYCLAGGDQGAVAAADTPFIQCAALGNPLEGAPTSDRESAAFASVIGAARRRGGAGFALQVSEGSGDETSVDYPAVTDQLTAGDWNRAAAANNRVEIRWRTQPKG